MLTSSQLAIRTIARRPGESTNFYGSMELAWALSPVNDAALGQEWQIYNVGAAERY
jgi:hypothetical protein